MAFMSAAFEILPEETTVFNDIAAAFLYFGKSAASYKVFPEEY
jgi:hypothetical protein